MKLQLTFKSGWSGGSYHLGGHEISFCHKPSATLFADGVAHEAAYRPYSGEDYDHGNIYRWTRIDPGVIVDMGIVPMFISAKTIMEKRPDLVLEMQIK